MCVRMCVLLPQLSAFSNTLSYAICTAVLPELVTSLMNATRAQGSSHTFVCAAVSDPRPVFVFRFNGERITLNSAKYALVTNSTHGTLTVLNLQGSDEGTYNCSASNRYGSVSTSALLIVQGVFESRFGNWICVAFW